MMFHALPPPFVTYPHWQTKTLPTFLPTRIFWIQAYSIGWQWTRKKPVTIEITGFYLLNGLSWSLIWRWGGIHIGSAT
ncbi:MAG: hypothetical protein HQL68_03505 [Magnetococcales bacterium]|nr:hypothetical protein [Magnetococcales bacterium]